MRKILIVEDDEDINKLLKEILNKNGYNTVSAYTGREALLQLKFEEFDLVILDLMMPGITGEEVIIEIRKNFKLPIVVVTAKIDKNTKINVLKMGADDFVKKPFDIDELLAQIEANIRRYCEFSEEKEKESLLTYGSLKLNTDTAEVKVNEEPIHLTSTEFEILKLLIRNPKKIFSKQNIYSSIWEDSYVYDENVINTHISNLRSKIKKIDNKDHIETVWGMGYRLK